ncbi:ABC-three component system protein [Draconibacterium sediminis]|uniref:ABC-three component system protein n=1 Tax=Draconibacterium sediminis TaxID=1544798 RepID=UPI000696DA12|nr:ABC-three component system protein [Draconibacterium sediminis]
MGSGARNYTDKTLKRLFGLSGNQCAFPGCNAILVNQRNALDSNICHIEAAKEGGERFNLNMTDEQRADYENLILLCRQHHAETNDEVVYTVDVLKDMKRSHESNYMNQRINNNPSMLRNAINAIAAISFDGSVTSESLNVINPKEKLSYNCVKTNYSLIQEYKVYHEKINILYDELESQGSIKKEKLLNNIEQLYIRIKGKYVLDSNDPINIIRQNADNIIDDIFDELYLQLENSNFFDEDIVLGIRLIMVDAFIRCKILEEPK